MQHRTYQQLYSLLIAPLMYCPCVLLLSACLCKVMEDLAGRVLITEAALNLWSKESVYGRMMLPHLAEFAFDGLW